MFFDIFRNHETDILQDKAKLQHLTANLMLQMVWADDVANARELELVERMLSHVYNMPHDRIRNEFDRFEPTRHDIDHATVQLKNLPVRERVQLLRDLWAVASVDGEPEAHEEALFYRAADMLEVEDNEFLERCIKPRHLHS